jgi:hypothetical protein
MTANTHPSFSRGGNKPFHLCYSIASAYHKKFNIELIKVRNILE